MDQSRPLEPHVEAARLRAETLLRDGASMRAVLAELALAVEASAPGASNVSVLVIDEDGLLRYGASPSLPADYLEKIDRLRPHPSVGTCAAAAATGRIVVTPDLRNDDKWAELRHLPLGLGFRAAWSMPLKDEGGRVVGTFGSYFRESREPTAAEMQAVAALAPLAARAIVQGRRQLDSLAKLGG